MLEIVVLKKKGVKTMRKRTKGFSLSRLLVLV
ncbi:MAG: hypothetical protein ACI9GH_000460, partial [Candidatus Paceibacteria bacterium]